MIMNPPEFKLFVCGPGGVGKTASIVQFVQCHFVDDYWNDYPDESYRKQCSINDRVVLFDIQDHYSTEMENFMYDQYMRNAQFFYVTFSKLSRHSFNEVEEYINRILRVKDPPTNDLSSLCIIVGNKCDRPDDMEVTTEEAKELARRYNCLYFETSARTRVNIEEAFCSCWTQYQKGLFSDEDKVTRAIPILNFPEYNSRFRTNISNVVDRAPHSDLVIESDDWEKFKMVCMLVNFSHEGFVYENEYWVPREVWLIIKDYLLYHKFFTTRYRFHAHKCIMLARFPTLMDFIKEHKINLNLPQNFEPQAMRNVLTWIYCGNLDSQPNMLKSVLPIAKKLKLYNLVAICEGRGHQPPVQKPLSFELLFNSEALSDFKFGVADKAGTKYIPVHKVLLYNQCNWFAEKFNQAERSTLKGEIIIDGTYELNLEFFKFFYEDCVSDNLPLTTILDILKLAQSRWAYDMTLYLQRKICQMLTYETAIPISRHVMTANHAGGPFNDYVTQWIGYRVSLMKQRDEWSKVPSDMKERWEVIRVRGRWKESEEDEKKEKCIIS